MIAGLTNPVRYYGSFSQAVREAAARVYGGMHYRNSTHKGGIIGKQVSRWYCQLNQFSTKKATRYGPATLISSICHTQKRQILFNLTVPS